MVQSAGPCMIKLEMCCMSLGFIKFDNIRSEHNQRTLHIKKAIVDKVKLGETTGSLKLKLKMNAVLHEKSFATTLLAIRLNARREERPRS